MKNALRLLLITCAILWTVRPALPVKAADAPNIILVMADDLGYGDLGCYGQRLIQTPRIDQLARDGIRFTQAYAGSCVCAATRAGLMTGMHNGHAVARDNIPHYATYLHEGDITLAELLQSAGYRCGGIGKWSLGDAGTEGRATRQGFDMWFGYLNQDHAHFYFTNYLDDNDGRLELPGNRESHQHYSHDLMTDRALQFVQDQVSSSPSSPFLLYAAYTLPHFSSSEEDPTRLPIPSNALYADRDWTDTEKNYAAMISLLDRDVGRLTDLVDELEIGDHTLIIFTSDNGPWQFAPARFDSNGALRGGKRELYEGGIRVPFVARWPGQIPAGRTCDDVIALWDLLPTFCELAHVAAPASCDGHSIVSAWQGQGLTTPHPYLYWDYGHCRARYDQAVRMDHWKGIRHGQHGDIELYDLAQDESETRDVALEHPQIVTQLAQIMADAATPHERYPIGQEYKGKPLWKGDALDR